MISIVYYFLLFPVAFAFNVSVYNGVDYYKNKTDHKPVLIDENTTYEFEYNLDENFDMDILLLNKAPNVTGAFYITKRATTNQTLDDKKATKNMTKCRKGDCLNISTKLTSQFISIGMQLNRGTVPCATHIVSEGRATSTSKRYLCVKPRNCVMVINLQNECGKDFTDPQERQQSPATLSQNNVYIYVIPSVIVMCVIVLGIYLSVKKFRNRSSDPEKLELNTFATKRTEEPTEVLYADLSFVQENIQPPKHEEESPYAEIMGVLRPIK